jgi:cold shock CspA family protein
MVHRKQGRLVKWRGSYGFIRYNGKDIFVHLSSYLHGFVPELNQICEFEIGPATKQDKPNEAFRVTVVKTADAVLHDFNEKIDSGVHALGRGGAS